MNRHLTLLFSGVVLASLLAPLSLSAQNVIEFRDKTNTIKATLNSGNNLEGVGTAITYKGDGSQLTGVGGGGADPTKWNLWTASQNYVSSVTMRAPDTSFTHFLNFQDVLGNDIGGVEYNSSLQSIGWHGQWAEFGDASLGYVTTQNGSKRRSKWLGGRYGSDLPTDVCDIYGNGWASCFVQNVDLTSNDLFVATGSAAGQWRNLRTGNGPGVYGYLIDSTMTFKPTHGESRVLSVLDADNDETVRISSTGVVNVGQLTVSGVWPHIPASSFFTSVADGTGKSAARFIINNFNESSLYIPGPYPTADLAAVACVNHGQYNTCLVLDREKGELYLSTGSAAGQWKSERTGGGVYENNFKVNECVVTSSYTNTSGGALAYGSVVVRNTSTGTITTQADSDLPIGAIQDPSGCANGAACKVGYSGICMVLLKDGDTCAYNTYVYNGDTAGRAQCGTSVGTAQHNREIGHPYAPLGTGGTNVVIPVQMHFN